MHSSFSMIISQARIISKKYPQKETIPVQRFAFPEQFGKAECAGTGIDLHLSFPQLERKIYVPTSF